MLLQYYVIGNDAVGHHLVLATGFSSLQQTINLGMEIYTLTGLTIEIPNVNWENPNYIIGLDGIKSFNLGVES